MRMALAISATMLAGCLSSVAWADGIYKETDKFTGTSVYHTEFHSVDLEGGSFLTERQVWFRFSIVPAAPGHFQYALAVLARLPDWAFISAGQTLVLKLDGNRFLPLTTPFGSSPAREVEYGGHVSEKAGYLLSPDDLLAISKAKKIDFRLSGDRQTIDGSWGNNLIEDAASLLKAGSTSVDHGS